MPKYGRGAEFEAPKIVHPKGAKSSNSTEPRDAKRGMTKSNPVK